MSGEIAIQKNGGKGEAPVRRIAKEWHPFRTMRELLRWDPFEAMTPAWPAFEGATFVPDFDVKETKENFVFAADVPGVAEKDLEVKVSGNRLSVSGKRESEKTDQGDTYYTTERSYGSFLRSFTLPEGVDADNVKAELKSGVLTLTVPKRPEAQSKKISVSSK